MFAVTGAGSLVSGTTVRDNPAGMTAFVWLARGVAYIPSAAAACWLCWLARRAGCNRRWSLAACALVALIAGLLLVVVRAPVTPGTGSLTLAFGWGGDHPFNFLQALVPLVVGLFFMRKSLPVRGPWNRPGSSTDKSGRPRLAEPRLSDAA
jgi:hypothetical protein